jgi:hypothetical protein
MARPPNEPHMRVYRDRVALSLQDGTELTFVQGPMSAAAQARYEHIVREFGANWLDNTAGPALSPAGISTALTPEWRTKLETLADGVTNQEGRAMVALAVLQMAIKAIEPHQSIRLTKGHPSPRSPRAARGGRAPTRTGRSDRFSWTEGLSMRGLSKDYLVPFLRRHRLLLLNRDGPFMTRSLAENYPYSEFYKADLRGPRQIWNEVVEALESGSLDPKDAFVYLCAVLSNRSEAFEAAAREALHAVDRFLAGNPTFSKILALIAKHVRDSQNPARPLEVAMHSLFQALYWKRSGSPYDLRELSQMRSANVKLGNVGDVELFRAGTRTPVEAWDAKFGIGNLTVELEELGEKLLRNRSVARAGFVMDRAPAVNPLTVQKIADAHSQTGADVTLGRFEEWALDRANQVATGNLDALGRAWLQAYAESLCQKRRDIAPIDEPSKPWVDGLRALLP